MNLLWVSIKSEELDKYEQLLENSELFDVLLHNYSETPFSEAQINHIRALFNFYVWAPREEKLHTAARVISERFLNDYDQFAFLDGDLEVSPDAIKRLFSVGNALSLPLYQPALTPASVYSHEFLRQTPTTIIRKVPFVEIMAPFFSRDALRACLPTFDINLSGWGLDVLLWPSKVAGECYVIDRYPIGHYNPPSRRERVQSNGKTPAQEYQELALQCQKLTQY